MERVEGGREVEENGAEGVRQGGWREERERRTIYVLLSICLTPGLKDGRE